MDKHIPEIYLFKDDKVEILPYFLYELTVYKLEKNRASMIHSQFYKSDKLIFFKKDIIIKNYQSYSVVTQINILGVTKEFVKENDLKLYIKKKRKNERTH